MDGCCELGECDDTRVPLLEDDEEIARAAKALGHPARVRIVRFLAGRASCFGGDLVPRLGLAQSTVSEHLRILKAAGLIEGETDGPRVCYCLNQAMFARVMALLSELIGTAGNKGGEDG